MNPKIIETETCGVGTVTPASEQLINMSAEQRKALEDAVLKQADAESAELQMFERAAREVKDVTVRDKAVEILTALGASFTPDGKSFFFDFPGSTKRTATLVGPKGETKLTSKQKDRRAAAKRARKARKASRR